MQPVLVPFLLLDFPRFEIVHFPILLLNSVFGSSLIIRFLGSTEHAPDTPNYKKPRNNHDGNYDILDDGVLSHQYRRLAHCIDVRCIFDLGIG